ncbi:MAG: homocysteine S-methyltransferase [Acidobacteriota bacterium]|nr:homocysteine S-methyltransferase [Acidobacteriota bacterium]
MSAKSTTTRASTFQGIHVLDGGFATELEYQGAKIYGPLWSAHVLQDAPEKILAVHRVYLAAGANCILTSSYQVSRMGYQEAGLPVAQADAALLRAVELARQAAAEFPERRVVIAASLGPYGAMLHNGAEYHGNYCINFEELVQFHRERIEIFAAAKGTQRVDLLAFETLPSLEEAKAIAEALSPWPELSAWFTFTCPDEENVAHGESLRDCATFVSTLPQTVAVGVNCTHPSLIASLICELKAASNLPIVVYPNSGEHWDATARCWTGTSDPEEYGELARRWFLAGAQIVGGCCRTRPAHIKAVAAAQIA